MEQQMDLILLGVTGLSVLAGYVRGLSDEILRLAVYVLSGILGYLFIPVFQPVFSVIPEEFFQRYFALFSGTIIIWFVLKIATALLTRKIRESRFKKLDKSLGGIFGGVRACLFLTALNFICLVLAPYLVESSKILTLSGIGTSCFFNAFPEYKNFEPKKIETTDIRDEGWKKRLLQYLQNTTSALPVLFKRTGTKRSMLFLLSSSRITLWKEILQMPSRRSVFLTNSAGIQSVSA